MKYWRSEWWLVWLAAWAPVAAADARSQTASTLRAELNPPPGFTATIFATAAEANYPVFMAATCDGTVFVSSDGNASLGSDPDRGRILRLRDTDGDGVADDVTTFVTNLDSPRGLVWVDERLIVLHPPHVTAFRDANRDGIADDQSGTRLVSGIAFDRPHRTADHTSSGLTIGVDGWIYAAIGDFGFMEAKGSDGRRLQLRGGGLVRFRPDGTGIDLFARGTRNTLEAAVGPLLDMIARDNTNDGGGWDVRLHAFTGLEDHGYPSRYMHFGDEIVAPLADFGGGAGTGACWIDEPWMPSAWNDAPFTCDFGRGAVYRHPLAARGAGYETTQEIFLKIKRPTDIDVDAVGNLYAASWEGGGFRWSGPDVGFIAMLRANDAPALPCPAVGTMTAGELVNVLAGPSHRLRLEAQRTLVVRGLATEAADSLEALAVNAGARLASRVAAMFAIVLGRKAEAVPVLVRLAGDPSITAWAVRALGDLAAEGHAVPAEVVDAALRSPDARTRKEAVVAIARLGREDATYRLLPLAADTDPIVRHTAVEAATRLAASDQAPVIAACIAALDASATQAAVHRAAARVLGEIHSEASATAVMTRLAVADDPGKRGDLVWAAARLWRREAAWTGDSWGTRPDTRGPYYAREEWELSPRLRDALVAALAAVPAGDLPGLCRTLGLHGVPEEALLPVLAARDPSGDAVAALRDAAGVLPRDAANERGGVHPLAKEVPADTGPTIATRPMDEVLDLVDEQRGDPAIGATLFVALKCSSCHGAAADGAAGGPSLANAAGNYNRRQLAESVLLPNKSIAQGFATTALVLDDGRSIIGFITSEGADHVSLRDSLGVEHTVAKAGIEERLTLPTSVMPEGLAAGLTLRQFASLIDHIQSLAQPHEP